LADDLRPLLDPARGRTNVFAMLKALEAAPTFGSYTDFSTCTRQFQARHRKKGLVVVLSDFLFPGGFSEGLKRLTGLGHEVHAIQILSDGDLRCDWKGDVELECVETHQRRKITITAREADAYAQAVATWNTALQSECAQRAIGFNTVSNTVPFEDVIRNILRKGGLAS
jgi:uncharacterized protein (DUF58 family)